MRYTNLNMDTTLGGNSASDEVIASQKAIKSYVDENDKDNITEMEDVDITEVSDGQVLSYDSSTNKWKNADATSVVIRKWNWYGLDILFWI